MAKLHWTRQAYGDLMEIIDYISDDNALIQNGIIGKFSNVKMQSSATSHKNKHPPTICRIIPASAPI